MEAIETELSNKIVEKPREDTRGEVKEVITDVEEKHPEPVKKPRSEAQKKAFEKARAKRMENLEKKKKVEVKPEPTEVKEIEGEDVDISNFETPPKKKRGRPKGSKSKKVIKHQEPAPTPQTPNYLNLFNIKYLNQHHLNIQSKDKYHLTLINNIITLLLNLKHQLITITTMEHLRLTLRGGSLIT